MATPEQPPINPGNTEPVKYEQLEIGPAIEAAQQEAQRAAEVAQLKDQVARHREGTSAWQNRIDEREAALRPQVPETREATMRARIISRLGAVATGVRQRFGRPTDGSNPYAASQVPGETQQGPAGAAAERGTRLRALRGVLARAAIGVGAAFQPEVAGMMAAQERRTPDSASAQSAAETVRTGTPAEAQSPAKTAEQKARTAERNIRTERKLTPEQQEELNLGRETAVELKKHELRGQKLKLSKSGKKDVEAQAEDEFWAGMEAKLQHEEIRQLSPREKKELYALQRTAENAALLTERRAMTPGTQLTRELVRVIFDAAAERTEHEYRQQLAAKRNAAAAQANGEPAQTAEPAPIPRPKSRLERNLELLQEHHDENNEPGGLNDRVIAEQLATEAQDAQAAAAVAERRRANRRANVAKALTPLKWMAGLADHLGDIGDRITGEGGPNDYLLKPVALPKARTTAKPQRAAIPGQRQSTENQPTGSAPTVATPAKPGGPYAI